MRRKPSEGQGQGSRPRGGVAAAAVTRGLGTAVGQRTADFPALRSWMMGAFGFPLIQIYLRASLMRLNC